MTLSNISLPGKRYFFRELLPRAVLITITFKLVLPLVPFALFSFAGDWVAAGIFGIAFTALFCVFGAYIMGSASARRFMEANRKRWWFVPLNVLIVLGVPAVALALAAWLAASVFAVNGLIALIVGSVLLNVVCAITHDYKAAS